MLLISGYDIHSMQQIERVETETSQVTDRKNSTWYNKELPHLLAAYEKYIHLHLRMLQ